jgi:alkanesulfonate monooxygenase SsuD/methylene tetrahydromethanopterin reductase-like flavin-dependent oxidoreductase (luciferase family)
MGERVMLRLVAEHADIWNGTGQPEDFARASAILDAWCERIGRDPATIERTCHIDLEAADQVEAYVAAGAQHLMIQCPHPFDLEPALRMLAAVGA